MSRRTSSAPLNTPVWSKNNTLGFNGGPFNGGPLSIPLAPGQRSSASRSARARRPGTPRRSVGSSLLSRPLPAPRSVGRPPLRAAPARVRGHPPPRANPPRVSPRPGCLLPATLQQQARTPRRLSKAPRLNPPRDKLLADPGRVRTPTTAHCSSTPRISPGLRALRPVGLCPPPTGGLRAPVCAPCPRPLIDPPILRAVQAAAP